MPCDYSKYHKDWKQISLYIRYTRANSKCEKCGVVNKSQGYRTKDGIFITLQEIEAGFKAQYDYFIDNEPLSHIRLDKGAKATTIVLTVSHYDHDKENNLYTNNPFEVWDLTKNNLFALCQRCHLMHDMDRHVANRKRNRELKYQETQLVINF